MKKCVLLVFVVLLSISSLLSQNVDTLTYTDNFSVANTTSTSIPLRAKALRKSSRRGGSIPITYTSNIADSLKQAIEIASLLWAESLPTDTKVRLKVSFGNIANDLEVQMSYLYLNTDTLYPMSYYNNYIANYGASEDATIVFSDTVNWSCSYSEQTNNNKSLTTAMMRGIAIALGFGTTAKQNNSGSLFFQQSDPGYSPFEYLVLNDSNVPLSSIPRGRKNRENAALRAYAESNDNIWLKWGGEQYKLYSHSPFEPNRSLIYLNEPSSLMHYEMPMGRCYLDIDDKTANIIKQIGWDIETTPNIDIYCTDIPNTGIASAYDTYLFEISNYNVNMSSLHWEYLVLSESGEFQIKAQQADSQTFSFSPFSYLSTSHINREGDIECIVRLTYTMNGTNFCITKKLTLECEPEIISLSDQSVRNNGYITLYDYSFNVSYRGAPAITIGVEQEYSAFYDIIHIDEPFLAHVYLSNLSRGNYVWIDISVENDYGSDLQTIEIPNQPPAQVKPEFSAIENSSKAFSSEIKYIDVYTSNGQYVDRIRTLSELRKCPSGEWILKYIGGSQEVIKTRKIHLK